MSAYEVNYGGLRVTVGLLEDSQDSHGKPKVRTAQLAFRPDPDLTGFGRDDLDAIVDLLRTARDEGYLPDPDEDDDYDGPAESDGFVTLGSAPGGQIDYEVRLEGIFKGRYPRQEFAVYQLARAMAESGSFPAAWMEGEHGPSSRPIDDEVRRHHDTELGEILLLPGARFAPGDDVIDSDGGWPCTVIFDYGDLGVHVHAQGDPDVTAIVPPGQLSRDLNSTAEWFAASQRAGCTGTGYDAGSDTIAHESDLPCPVHPGL